MSTSDRINRIADLKKEREKAARLALKAGQDQLQEQEAVTRQLHTYAEEYGEAYASIEQTQMVQLQNFRRFLDGVIKAEESQEKVTELRREATTGLRKEWLKEWHRYQSLLALRDKRRAEEKMTLARREERRMADLIGQRRRRTDP